MTFLQRFWRAEAMALLALLICAIGIAAYGFADSFHAGQSSLISPSGALWIGFAYTVAIGLLPTVVYGAPVYAFLSFKRRASWVVTIGIGLLPGALMLPF